MYHDHGADGSRTQTPTVLPRVKNFAWIRRVLEVNFEHTREVLAKMMGCSTLQTTYMRYNVSYDIINLNAATIDCDIGFNCGREVGARKLFLFRFAAFDDRNGEQILIDFGVELEDLKYFALGVFLLLMSSVTLLPQKLACSDKRCWLFEFPSLQLVIGDNS